MKRLGLVFATGLALSGCSTLESASNLRPLGVNGPGSGSALVQGSTVRSAYAFNGHLCPEPPPDASLQFALKAAGSAKTPQQIEANASFEDTATVLQLAGRTQTVLVARDMLYTLCFLGMNGFMDEEDVAKGYQGAIRVIQTIAKTAQADAEKDKAAAQGAALAQANAAGRPTNAAAAAIAAGIVATDTSNAAAVADRFSRADGTLLTDELSRFAKDKDVAAALGGPSIAQVMLLAKTRADLEGIVADEYGDHSATLAVLAKNFERK